MNTETHCHKISANASNSLTITSNGQSRPLLEPKPGLRNSRLGVPRFKWSLKLLGLCIYSFAIITFKFPVAQLGVIIGVAGLFIDRDSVRIPGPIWLFLAFGFWMLLSSVVSPFAEVAINAGLERLKLPIIMFVAINALRTEGQIRFYLLFVLSCFVLFPARGTILGGDTDGGRVVWNYIYSNSNDLAGLCLIALGIALSIIFSETSWNFIRLGAVFSAAALLVVILLTQSRGAFLGLMAITGPPFISMLVKRSRRAVTIAIVTVLIISFAIPGKVWDRLSGIKHLTSTETITEADNEGSAKQRLEILKVGLQIFLDNPAFGVGPGSYGLANARYSHDLGEKDTHNTYLNLAAEAGLPGLLLWCTLVGSVLRHAHRAQRLAKDGMFKLQHYWIKSTFIGYLVAGIFGSYASLSFPYLMLSVLWCSATLLAANQSRSSIHHRADVRRP